MNVRGVGGEENDQNANGEAENASSSGASAFIRHISQVDGMIDIYGCDIND